MTFIKRVQSPTPKFFIKLRNIALTAAAVGTTVLAAPIAIPVLVAKLAGYLVVAGSVATVISQSTTDKE